jgi:hypothetical protein
VRYGVVPLPDPLELPVLVADEITLVMLVNADFSSVARPLMLLAMASAMSPAIRPYSMAVTPSLSLRKRLVIFLIFEPSE